MWAYDFSEWEPGAFARNVSNENYPFAGSTTRLYADGTYEFNSPGAGIDVQYYGEGGGEVTHEYTEGPFAGEVTYSIYTSQDAAVLALTSGEVDYMLTSLGLQRGLQQLILAEPDLDLIVNPSNAYRYLAFNTRKAPMNDTAFRQAMACLIDKEFMANTVLGGAAIPVWSQVPEGNAFWYNPDAPRWCQGLTQEERLNTAVQLLEDAGYTWDTKPVWDPDNLDALPKGEGLRSPNGDLIPEMTLLAPGPGYDPLRATYALFIEDWANDLGVPVRAEPTGFNVIVDAVFTTDPQFDMYILGWTLNTLPGSRRRILRNGRGLRQRREQHPWIQQPRVRRPREPVQRRDRPRRGSGPDPRNGRDPRRGPPLRGAFHHPDYRAVPHDTAVPLHVHPGRNPEPGGSAVVRTDQPMT
jgi:ABC-type transport system substrate-binding protein